MKKLTNKGFVGIGLVLLALVSAGLLFVRHENAALPDSIKSFAAAQRLERKFPASRLRLNATSKRSNRRRFISN